MTRKYSYQPNRVCFDDVDVLVSTKQKLDKPTMSYSRRHSEFALLIIGIEWTSPDVPQTKGLVIFNDCSASDTQSCRVCCSSSHAERLAPATAGRPIWTNPEEFTNIGEIISSTIFAEIYFVRLGQHKAPARYSLQHYCLTTINGTVIRGFPSLTFTSILHYCSRDNTPFRVTLPWGVHYRLGPVRQQHTKIGEFIRCAGKQCLLHVPSFMAGSLA